MILPDGYNSKILTQTKQKRNRRITLALSIFVVLLVILTAVLIFLSHTDDISANYNEEITSYVYMTPYIQNPATRSYITNFVRGACDNAKLRMQYTYGKNMTYYFHSIGYGQVSCQYKSNGADIYSIHMGSALNGVLTKQWAVCVDTYSYDCPLIGSYAFNRQWTYTRAGNH